MPDVLADRHSKSEIIEHIEIRPGSGFKIAGFIENIVGRQELLAGLKDNRPVSSDDNGVIQRFAGTFMPSLDTAEHHIDGRQIPEKPGDGLFMVVQEGAPF
jgi:hypothetical protein